MAQPNDLDKLFEAALNEKEAPSRYGTPDELKKSAPAAFSRQAPARVLPAGAPSPFRAAPSLPNSDSGSKAGGSVTGRTANADASLDSAINTELAALMDAKIAKTKRRRRRSFIFTMLFFAGVAGGGTGWVVLNPQRFEAFKMVLSEIKSVGDINAMVAKYQKALDKIAVRGDQINDASKAFGVDPTKVDEHGDSELDKQMQGMMGEDGGKTTAARDKLLREKFNSVKESGSLIPKKEGDKKEDPKANQ